MIRVAQHSRKRRLISLTPLIDVVFILLVFFMLASSFLDWRAIALTLPASSGNGTAETPPLVVTIEDGSQVRLNGAIAADPIFRNLIAARLKQVGDTPVLIRAGDGIPLQRAVAVLEMVTDAGGENVSLSHVPGKRP